MNRTSMWLASGVLIGVASFVYAEPPSGGTPDSSQAVADYPEYHLFVRGVVQTITDDDVFLKTDEGVMREFSLKQVRKDKIKGLKAGDRLELELDAGDQIVDIGLAIPGAVKRLEKVLIVRGEVEQYDRMKKVLTLTRENGASKTFIMKPEAAVRMNDVQTGTRVTLELDPRNLMVEDFK
jgi:hypothetical protein